VPLALTAALYLLGHGYRLIADSGAGVEASNAMIHLAAQGHCELCLGQGGELSWMRKPEPLSSAQVLEIFRNKTAPSFDVVFRLGAICGGATPAEHAIIKAYSEAMGIAYQIFDDLEDFKSGGDADDVRAGRPSIVVAAACEQAREADRRVIEEAWCGRRALTGAGAETVRELIRRNGGEEKAGEFLAAYKDEALRSLRPLENRNLKLLLHRIVAMVFERG
jgi:geranylgeranyl pyrophosphate synthase